MITFLTDFESRRLADFGDAQWQQMKINAPFAAVECRVLRRVIKNLQAVFDLASGGEVNESIIAGVKTAEETGNAASSSCAG